MNYRVRRAGPADIATIVRHRIRMFEEMGTAIDAERVATAFSAWLETNLATDTYCGWVADTTDGTAVAGAGITLLTWPPGPRELSGRLPIVYNVYTEPDHRRRGVAKALMETIHDWCRDAGYRLIGLAASAEGKSLYESLGYRDSRQPFMFLQL
jgi:GNAT superfamily N-acetyltransferase